MATPDRPGCPALLALALILLALVPAARAQVREDALRAAFVFNFASFTTWTGTPGRNDLPLQLCSYTAQGLHEELQGLGGQRVKGREVRVRALGRWREIDGCDVLVVDRDRLDEPAAPATAIEVGIDLADADRGAVDAPPPPEWWLQAGVLTVLNGDDTPVQPSRASIVLFREGDRVRFDVDAGTAAAVGVEFSSRLLTLARRIW